jgi:hypothetical protein
MYFYSIFFFFTSQNWGIPNKDEMIMPYICLPSFFHKEKQKS